MRTLGTVVRGVRAPIFRQGDDAVAVTVETVLNALRENGIEAHDKDVVAITESVVARCQGNYATVEQISGFLASWNRKRDHKQRIYISYDSTNKNCQAGDIDIVEFGKPKDDEGVPVFNIGLAFDKTNSVPLFYEEYLGSINDVSQFQHMVDKVREYK